MTLVYLTKQMLSPHNSVLHKKNQISEICLVLTEMLNFQGLEMHPLRLFEGC